MNSRCLRLADAGACLVILALVLAVFGQVWSFDFVSYDDTGMVHENPHVLSGFTWENVRWAFTHGLQGIWMPVTILTYLLDAELFGNWPGGYHLSSVLFHALGAVLLYLALRTMTGDAGRSLFVALVFAIHPLRADSVAWISERKDVLCGLFWFLALLAYAHYARKPRLTRYGLVVLAAALALMSKSMAVTLPFTLLLLDWWPLRRIAGAKRAFWLCLEKAPLLALSALGSWAAFATQKSAHAVSSLERLPLGVRTENVIVSYVRYLGHLFWPTRLSVFYPYPMQGYPPWKVIAACAVLALITLVVLAFFRRRRLAVGWFWYLGTLVPVIGIVQIGAAALANRYTYVPCVGILLMLVWAVPSVAKRGTIVLRGLAAALIGVLSILAWVEVGYYRDTETLFRRAMAVTQDNYLAYQKIGELLAARGEIGEAVRLYREARRLQPGDAESNYNLGSALIQKGDFQEAAMFLSTAVQLDPKYALAQTNLGVALLQLGRADAALFHLAEGVRLDPDGVNARINYGVALLRSGRPREAAEQFRQALRLDPQNRAAQTNLDLAHKALQEKNP